MSDTMTQDVDVQDQTQTDNDQTADSGSGSDPFSIDEGTLAQLTPEARVAFDSATKSWREKADSYAKTYSQKELEKVQSKYKDYDEKSQHSEALNRLVSDPRFAQWYQQTYQQQQQQQQQSARVASPEEWAQAISEAAGGNEQKLQGIIARQFQMMASPTIRQFQEQQQTIVQDRELDSLFRRHPDADELDDPKIWGEGKTPLELAIHQVVDREGKTFEEAYQVARSMVDAANSRARNAAHGIVDAKKNSVTEAASKTSKETDTVIEVASAEEALRKNVEAAMRKQNVTYVAKSRLSRR